MKEISSRALELNLAAYRVDVTIDPKYNVILNVMSRYDGLQKPLKTFLEELNHPRKNWQFIVDEARTFSLGYFFDLKTHPRGTDAVRIYTDIIIEAMENAKEPKVKTAAFNNLYLLLQKFIKESGEELKRFLPVITYSFTEIYRLSYTGFSFVLKSYYRLNRLAGDYLDQISPDEDCAAINNLLCRYFKYTYSYWLSEKDPEQCFAIETDRSVSDEVSGLFSPISHLKISELQKDLQKIADSDGINSSGTLRALLELPGYGDIADIYSTLPDKLYDVAADEKLKHQYKFIFLCHTISISGLSNIHENTLREINRDTAWLINHEDIEHIQNLISTTFNLLDQSIGRFPDTVLKSVLNIGKGVYETNESDLVQYFNEHVVRLGFQTPDFTGISDEWQIQSNHSHIQNIRVWMELIKLHPKWSKKLLSSCIIHLSLNGVLIKDTDLFPRDITGFLNSEITPVYNLAKQLLRLFPAYFNEIGAEGRLRDISTQLDEACRRKDVLIHFLRKQSHVESSNKTVSLMEAVLEFWRTKAREGLKPYLPHTVYEQISPEGQFIDGVSNVLNKTMEKKGLDDISGLLFLDNEYTSTLTDEFPEKNRIDADRVSRAVFLYKTLNEKYSITSFDIDRYIAQVEASLPLNFDTVRNVLASEDTYEKLCSLLDFLEELRKLILSPEPYPPREDIYRKRHIAADIPSMYGSYREAKFDAMGLTFRLEALVNSLFEELVEGFDLSFITHSTFHRIYDYLTLFSRALNTDGIPAIEFENQLNLLYKSLNIRLVTYTQYIDIFRDFALAVNNMVSDYFDNVHRQNLREIADSMSQDKLLPKYCSDSQDRDELFNKAAEIFLRDTISSSLGIQKLDLFLTRILNTLRNQAEKLPPDKHHLLITYSPRNTVTSLSAPYSDLSDIIHLGNKSLNIIKMINHGIAVPPGFVITTEVFRCRELIESYPPANKNFRESLDREIKKLEEQTGSIFGSPDNTLLVSVRSGAAVSQPGMLDSYLNVGINEGIVKGMIQQTGQAWFAWDCYRRFMQSYGMSFGLERDSFDAIIGEIKSKHRVSLKKQLTSEQMEKVAKAYKEFIISKGIAIEESPKEQLYIAIQRVLNSWTSQKAFTYRKIMGISDDWGTAVTVQKMVFGNSSSLSGSGVLFTHSPKFSLDVLRLWGDYTIGNQGEDVVSGLVATHPISDFQARYENRPTEFTLENRFPEIYLALRNVSKVLIYENQWAPQDIEFTFEGPKGSDLYILQTRDMEIREKQKLPVFDNAQEITGNIAGYGIGVSGGALSGRAVFSLDDIHRWREVEKEIPLILIRRDTVPDDIKEISESDGLLTARGGATSHAAIVANRLGKTCVVGCTDLECMEKEGKFTINGKVVNAGDFISIDGYEGSIYIGKMRIGEGRR
jgi:pyruvate,orthophosphate dikinase